VATKFTVYGPAGLVVGGTISGVTGPIVGPGNHVALIPPLGLGNYNRCTLFMHLSKFCPSSPHAGKRGAIPGD